LGYSRCWAIAKKTEYRIAMHIVRIQRGPQPQVSLLQEHRYEKEKDLERDLASSPLLIQQVMGTPIHLLASSFRLPGDERVAGLYIDSDGRLLICEARLARNLGSAREVLGQLLDHVSALSQYRIENLSAALSGKLEEVLRTISRGDIDRYTALWQQVSDHLTAGRVGMALVLDRAPAHLQRICRYLCQNVRIQFVLLTLKRFRASDDSDIIVPTLIAQAAQQQAQANLLELAVQYAHQGPAAIQIEHIKHRGNSLAIHPRGWPTAVRYEFLIHPEQDCRIGIELRIDDRDMPQARDLIRVLGSSDILEVLKIHFDSARIIWEAVQSPVGLAILFDAASEPEALSSAMSVLMELTYARVTERLRHLVRPPESQPKPASGKEES
jgi:hypothetical protein